MLQGFFEGHLAGARRARSDRGGMLVKSVLELAGVDEVLGARASRHLVALERFFRACLTDAGASNSQAEELVAVSMLLDEGIRVSSRRRLPEARQRKAIDAILRPIRSAIA